MRNILLVGTGGFLGSVSRYLLGMWITRGSGAARFPYGTMVVNITGCLVIGVLAGLADHRDAFTPATRLLLFTGFLGGYTTFSAFALETYFLGREQLWSAAVLNVVLQVLIGLAAVALGHRAAVLVAG